MTNPLLSSLLVISCVWLPGCFLGHTKGDPGDAPGGDAGNEEPERSCGINAWVAGDMAPELSVYPPRPDGAESARPIRLYESAGSRFVGGVAHADVDGDGRRDVVIRDLYGGAAIVCDDIQFTVFHRQDGPFWEWKRTRVEAEQSAGTRNRCDAPRSRTVSAVGDWNGDGYGDVWVPGYLFYGSAKGLRAEPAAGPCAQGDPAAVDPEGSAVLGDLSGDGAPELRCRASAEGDAPGPAGETLSIVRGGPEHERVRGRLPEGIHWDWRPAGDLDGDGYGDVFTPDWSANRLVIAFGDAGDGPLSTRRLEYDGNFKVAAVGDVDGDGLDDLMVLDDTGVARVAGTADRDFEVPTGDGQDLAPAPRQAGDTDCDGHADVLVTRSHSREEHTALYRGAEAGANERLWTLPEPQLIPVPAAH